MQKFMNKYDLKRSKSKSPIMVTLSGKPGSGKTTVAKELSKNLKLFILSNDYVRNYYLIKYSDDEIKKEKIPKLVKNEGKKRLIRLLLNKSSVVIDADLNTVDILEKYELISKVFGYDFIKFKINSSSDEENIERIQKRVLDYEKKDYSVIGDNCDYSGSYPKEVYYQIIERKPQDINDEYYDFVIDNTSSVKYLDDQVRNISGYIKGFMKSRK